MLQLIQGMAKSVMKMDYELKALQRFVAILVARNNTFKHQPSPACLSLIIVFIHTFYDFDSY